MTDDERDIAVGALLGVAEVRQNAGILPALHPVVSRGMATMMAMMNLDESSGPVVRVALDLSALWTEQQHDDTDKRVAFNDLLGDVDVSL